MTVLANIAQLIGWLLLVAALEIVLIPTRLVHLALGGIS